MLLLAYLKHIFGDISKMFFVRLLIFVGFVIVKFTQIYFIVPQLARMQN